MPQLATFFVVGWGLFFLKFINKLHQYIIWGERKQLSLSSGLSLVTAQVEGDGESGADIHEFAIVNEVYR